MNRREFFKLGPAFPAAAMAVSLVVREDGKEPIEANVSVLQAEPGDIVVLQSHSYMDPETSARLIARFHDCFPNLRVMVLDRELTLEGVLRTA